MERTKMRIQSTIVLAACQLIAFSLATEYVFSSECLCNGTLSNLKLHADVDHEKQFMMTYLTGIATNFSEQSLRAYPAMYKDEQGCNNLDEKTLREEAATSDSERDHNPGAEKIHKYWRTYSGLTPTISVDDTRATYASLFTGCYFFEYKPAQNTCSTCYTNPIFIKTSMDYVRLIPVQDIRPPVGNEVQLDVTIPLRQMRIFVYFYEHSNVSKWGQPKPTATCNVSSALSFDEKVNQECDGNITIGMTDNGTEKWVFRMRWNQDRNFRSVNYSWNLDSHSIIDNLFFYWDIPTQSGCIVDDFFLPPPPEDQRSDLVWIIIVGLVGVVIILCIFVCVIRDRVKKKKKKITPEAEAVPEKIARGPQASDILLLYAPGTAAFQQLINDVKEKIRMHCQCRVFDYRAILEYSEDWSIGPKELVDEWFNRSSNRIVWFDTPQLRAHLRPGCKDRTSNDSREDCLWDALVYARTNHLDLPVLASRHFVCRIKGIPEYVVTTESDNPLSWITRGVHCYLPDHMTVLLEMLSGKNITQNGSPAENEVAGQDSSNEEKREMNGHKNNQELGNNLDKNGTIMEWINGYSSKDGYASVSTSDNDVNENDRLDSRTSGEIELRQPLRDPTPIV